MSQEERDARLGLTGLTGAERAARMRLLTEQVRREAAAARAALRAQRARRAAGRAAADTSAPKRAGAEETLRALADPERTGPSGRRRVRSIADVADDSARFGASSASES